MLGRALLLILPVIGAVVAVAGPEDESPVEAPQGPEATKGPEPGDPEKAAPVDPQEALKRLNHEDFQQRKAAQADLLEWGKQDMDQGIETLYGIYRSTDDPEVRLRTRQVLKRLVILKQPFEGPGYLGVRMENAQFKAGDGEIQPAVRITEVREGTAAEAAKLQPLDLVTKVDNVVFDDLMAITIFAEYIKSKKAGEDITLHVRRGEQSLQLKATLRRRSPALDRLIQWGAIDQTLPKQSILDENDFKDWLRERKRKERGTTKGRKKPAVAP